MLKKLFTNITTTESREYGSLQAGSHLGAHARAAKSKFKSEAILREESGDEAQSLKDRFAFEFALCHSLVCS